MLEHKSAANLRAGEILLAHGLIDPAATRYYYALFQAAVTLLARQGRSPGQVSSGALEWSHGTLANQMASIRGRRADRELFKEMRWLRERADYGPALVEAGYLAARIAAVRDFVEEVTR